MIDTISAKRFLAALINDGSPPAFQTFDDNETRKKAKATRGWLARKFYGDLDEHLKIFAQINTATAGAGVFIQINAGARGSQNVTKVRAIFIDDDEGRVTAAMLEACPPSLIVATSPGRFAYYWLVDECAIIDYRKAQRHLAAHFGTDKSVHNADRVMRLPGTLHLKHPEKPFRVKLIACFPERRFTVGKVLDCFPLPLPGAIEDEDYDGAEPIGDGDPTGPQRAKFNLIIQWLTRKGLKFQLDPKKYGRLILDRCIFNPDHGNTLAIMALSSGGQWAGCFHNSCGGNKQIWKKVAAQLGGWYSAAPGFALGDHTEIAERTLNDLRVHTTHRLVYAHNKLQRYSPDRFIWESVSEDPEQSATIFSYSGLRKGQTGTVRIDSKDVTGIVQVMKRMAAEPAFFAEAEEGIMFENGFLKIVDGKATLVPPQAGHRQRKRMPFAWDPQAKSDRWLRFLREAFVDDPDVEFKIIVLQQYAGACLIGIATRFQKALLLLGEGANGKSVFIETVMRLFVEEEIAHVPPQRWGDDYMRAMLAGVRINVTGELPTSDIMQSEAFKGVVDGTPMTARTPYHAPFSFKPVAGNIFAANDVPGIVDFSHGFWRRFLIVPFNRVFEENEWDTRLKDYFARHEMPGICAWAVRGAEALLQADGFAIPQSSKDALAGIREQADPVAMFLKTETTPADALCSAREVYGAFRAWSAEYGHRTMSIATFGKRLAKLKIKGRHTDRGSMYPLKVLYAPSATIY